MKKENQDSNQKPQQEPQTQSGHVSNEDIMKLLKRIGAKDVTSEMRGQTFIIPSPFRKKRK